MIVLLLLLHEDHYRLRLSLIDNNTMSASIICHDNVIHFLLLPLLLPSSSLCACGLAVVSQYFASLLGASRVQAVEARSTLMLELKTKEAQIIEIEER